MNGFNNVPMPTLAMGGISPRVQMRDSEVAGGLAFLQGELEKRDPKLREPLTSTTWPRDIVSKTGGGFVEYASSYNVSYATTGSNQDGIIGGQTNDIPMIQADIGKELWKMFVWGNLISIPLIDKKMLESVGRSLDDLYDKGLHLNYDKTLDTNVYTGFPRIGTYGLVNNPNITTAIAPAGASGSTEWSGKAVDEILNDINQVMADTWAASEYDITGMANHILLPPKQYTMLVERKVGENGDKSILNFLLENNIGRNQGIDLIIVPSRWCIGAGEGGMDRLAAYANNEDRVHFEVTVPLARVITQASARDMAYLSTYAAQFSQVKFLYTTPAKYYDGI
jgi:hypothetical protein